MRATLSRSYHLLLILLVLVLLALLVSGPILAQTGGGYDLGWNTIASGGSSSAAGYTLMGTSGQPEAGIANGNAYTLYSGFGQPTGDLPAGNRSLYLPIIRH